MNLLLYTIFFFVIIGRCKSQPKEKVLNTLPVKERENAVIVFFEIAKDKTMTFNYFL
ncbi:hypothetical protein SAMN04487894_11581 [Niabella drilacis]|uniref:Uncharacterized protein n=1 Tax=Niabella drilacis (strain DSM 25811 / CCM 8410 / CCUG 62505 / LMG 26954 / E90) TaxID=1285928 RepID=A0A1G6YDB7_NIADE|nr:hypothetical protein SAMN04487894_11581 [Niabella drilacis]